MPSDFNRIDALFSEAVNQPDPAARNAFLNEACAGQLDLRQRVEALLRAHDDVGSFLQLPITEEAEPAALLTEGPGTRIGPYKLTQEIGQGGFGVVFMAEQEIPVRRRVALKIIKPGMDTRQIVARFEAERQALALMEHPHIAKVFDAGATATGRPYFVMELVSGVPITEYCDSYRLAPSERLELFLAVCQAVQHAHQKGIIHRDIKPNNVLITRHDDQPVVKVIDFGIAKATGGRLTDKTMFTEVRQMIGTPAYMSPEQAGLSELDVDTRSDIYSLGVLLYELLTGSTPFDVRELLKIGYDEIQRVIREIDPPTPSQRLSTLRDTLPTVAQQRNTEPKRLSSRMRGDLDWIVMKALEKDRSRRYDSATAMAADVLRHLAGEPVIAAPPSRLYRWRKTVRRNRGPVLATAVVLLALLAGMLGTTLGFVGQYRLRRIADEERTEAVKQRKLAESERAEADWQRRAAERQTQIAKDQVAIAEAVSQFQVDMLNAADPTRMLGDRVTVLQVMQAAGAELDAGKLAAQPLVDAKIRDIIGYTLRRLGRYDDAHPQLEKALELRRQHLPAGHMDLAWSLGSLAEVLYEMADYSQAEPLFRQALTIRREARPPVEKEIVKSLDHLTYVLHKQRRDAEAESLSREAVEIGRHMQPINNEQLANSLGALANVTAARGKLAEAEKFARESLQLQRDTMPQGHLYVAESLDILRGVLMYQGKFAEAEALQLESLEIVRKAYPAGHRAVAHSLRALGQIWINQNKLADAEGVLRESLEICRAALPSEHVDTADALSCLAGVLEKRGNLADAETMQREALAITRKAMRAGHPDVAVQLNNLSSTLLDQGNVVEAARLAREALEIARQSMTPDDPNLAAVLGNLAVALKRQQRFADAEPLLREAMEICRRALPTGHPSIANTESNYALLLQSQQRLDEAESLFRDALAIQRSTQPAGHPDIATILTNLGILMLDKEDFSEAERYFQEALDIHRQALPDQPAILARDLQNLGSALLASGQIEKAVAIHRELLDVHRKTLPPEHPQLVDSLLTLSYIVGPQQAAESATLAGEAVRLLRQAHPDGELQLAIALNLQGGSLNAQRQYDQAAQVFREALVEFGRLKTTDDPGLAVARLGLGTALTGLNQYADAESSLVQAEQQLAALGDQPRGARAACQRKLVELYQAWNEAQPEHGYDEKATEWQVRLAPP